MIQIEKQDLQTLKQILHKYPYTFYAYGSRTKGVARQFSDLDLCYQEEISLETVCQIKEELEESNFIIELVNWKHMRPNFQEFIKQDLVKIKFLLFFILSSLEKVSNDSENNCDSTTDQ